MIEDFVSNAIDEFIFTIQETESLESFKYPQGQDNVQIQNNYNYLLPFLYNSDESEKFYQEYNEMLERNFLYKHYEKENDDIIKFSLEYLKHNKSIAFPSVLVLKKIPEIIKYEISSKHVGNVFEGTLTVR